MNGDRSCALREEELGPPVAHLALKDGTPVYDRNGNRIGVVEDVIDVGGIFEGVVIHTHPLPGRHLYAKPEQIAEMHSRALLLAVDRDELHDPKAEPARGRGEGGSRLDQRLRRAWDWLSRGL